MSSQVSTITLRAKYEGDLRGLNDDIAKLKSIGRNLSANNPFKIRASLDFSRIAKDAAEAGKMAATSFQKSFQSAMAGGLSPGSSVSKGGIIIPASAAASVKSFQTTSSGAFKQITKDGDKVIKTFEQLERGVQRITTTTKKGNKKTVTDIDTRPLENFKKSLAEIERAYASQIGAARGGKGDVAGVLAQKQKAINDVLSGANLKDLPGNDRKRAQAQLNSIRDTPIFQKAEKSLDRLEERIASTRGNQDRVNTKQSRGLRIDALKDSLLGIDTATAGAIGSTKGTKGDVAAILQQKRNSIEAELAKYSDIADSPAYKQAQKAINNLDKGVAQAIPTQQTRATNQSRQQASQQATRFISDTDRQENAKLQIKDTDLSASRLIQTRAVREAEVNRILNEREKILQDQIALYRQLEAEARKLGNTGAADKYRTAGNRINNDLGRDQKDRAKDVHLAAKTESDAALKANLTRVTQQYKASRDQLKAEEDATRKNSFTGNRSSTLEDIHNRRKALNRTAQVDVANIGVQADQRGLHGVARQAQSSLSKITSQGAGDMERLAAATNKSGHAFDFHSNSLLKNAATFVQWYAPAQLAMKTFSAVGFGISSAVDAQRTFKILGAVYQGTAEEAAHLADQTLMLAAANGRDSKEAADSVVAWARLGLTRTQALMAVETSLQAANVAEVSAAEATAYLTANYKAFGQTIADIPATLDYINSLSNKNAVAPKQIFEGLARGGKIAKQAGLELEAVAAIITTVSATTQRPGSEVGNTIKTTISRLGRPKVQKDLKEQFGYDISTATGDAKKMEQVLGDLAALYPTLNTLEQGRLLNIVAGATQGNRFAIILDTWNEKLVAQATAELDTNSAMRENAQILDTVSAKLAELETSWTRLFHTLGESGAFDVVTQLLAGVSEGINNLGADIQWLMSLMGQGEGTFGKFMKANSKRAGKHLLDPGGYLIDLGKDAWNGELLGAKNEKPKTVYKNELAKMASETVEVRKNLNASTNSAQFYENISKSLGAKGDNPTKTLELFDKATDNLKRIPGAKEIGDAAIRDVRPLMVSGKNDEARAALAQIATDLRQNGSKQFQSYQERNLQNIKRAEGAIEKTKQDLQKTKEASGKATDEFSQKQLQVEIAKTTELIKEQENSLATLKNELQKPVTDPYTDAMRERLARFTADVTLASDAYAKLMDQFGQTGFSGLDAKLKLGGAMLERNVIGQTLDTTRIDNAAKNAADTKEIQSLEARRIKGGSLDNTDKIDPMIDELKRSIDARNSAATDLAARFELLDKATEETARKIEIERQTAELNTQYQDSRSRTQSGLSRYEIGRSEGQRLAGRTFGAIGELQADVANPLLGAGNTLQDSRELGALSERLVQSKQGLSSMEDRMNRALAERVNLEGDIAEASRKQTEELSKRLALAGREDQLRVAASAAFLRANGQQQYSMSQFQFFSQETRGAISNLAPNTVRGLDDSERGNAEARGKLNTEILNLGRDISTARRIFTALTPLAEAKGASIMDTKNPLGKGGLTGREILDPKKDEIRMNLDTGPININLDFSKHVQTILDTLQGRFDKQAAATLQSVKRMMSIGDLPNTLPAAGVW